jgi:type IV secretion system protein VirB4
MEHLLHTPSVVPVVLRYLFHRLEQRLTGAPMLIILDEGWLYLDFPVFQHRLREWFKTLRKRNASVIFASQSLADAAESAISAAINESCLTRIFLPNARALEAEIGAYYQRYGLNERQRELIARAVPRRQYYYQGSRGNRLFELELGPLALAFCGSGTLEDLAMLDTLTHHDPADFPAAWLRYKGLTWAADLLTTAATSPSANHEEDAYVRAE